MAALAEQYDSIMPLCVLYGSFEATFDHLDFAHFLAQSVPLGIAAHTTT